MWIEDIYNDEGEIIAYKHVKSYFNEKKGKNLTVSKRLKSRSKQAQTKAEKILDAKINEINSVRTDFYLKTIAVKYFETKKGEWESNTYGITLSYYENHVETHPINNYLISKITTSDIQDLMDKSDLAPTSLRKLKALISGILTYAEKIYHVKPKAKLTNLYLPPVKKSKDEIKFIDSSILPIEIARMREIMLPYQADALEVQIHTGLRFGEVAALNKDDLKGDRLTINKIVDFRNKNKIEPRTKTEAGLRTIRVNDRVLDIINFRIKENEIHFGDEAHLLFPTGGNKPVHLSDVNARLKNVNENYKTHVMRHTHISLLAENGFDLKYVMHRVGHVDSTTTLKIYTHVTQKMANKNDDKLNNLF